MSSYTVTITSSAPGTETAIRKALDTLADNLTTIMQGDVGGSVSIEARADDDGTPRLFHVDEIVV